MAMSRKIDIFLFLFLLLSLPVLIWGAVSVTKLGTLQVAGSEKPYFVRQLSGFDKVNFFFGSQGPLKVISWSATSGEQNIVSSSSTVKRGYSQIDQTAYVLIQYTTGFQVASGLTGSIYSLKTFTTVLSTGT